MSEKIIVYAHPFCPTVSPIVGMLKSAKADYEYINIHRDYTARERVRDINHGYESVPTLVFPDGSTLTEPSEGQLTRKLQEMGYSVPLSARLLGNAHWLVIGLGVLLAVLRALLT